MSNALPAKSGRDVILEAAIAEFAEHGYRGASTAGIARRAQVTQPLVHHHFGSKEGLWNEVLKVAFLRIVQDLVIDLTKIDTADPRERIRQEIRSALRVGLRHPDLIRITVHARFNVAMVAESKDVEAADHQIRSLFLSYYEHNLASGLTREFEPAFLYCLILGACILPVMQGPAIENLFGINMGDEKVLSRYAEAAALILGEGLLTRPSS